jgi:hypothetical protein
VRPRLVACDLDGTLLRSDGTLDGRTERALVAAEEAGAEVVICTARPPRWLRGLIAPGGPGAVAICANGAVVWDMHVDEALSATPLPETVARELVQALKAAAPGGDWAVERITGFAREAAYVTRWPVPPDTPVAEIEQLLAEPAVKVLFRHDQFLADALLELARDAAGHLAELSHSNSADCLIEISAAGVSKASALASLCAARGISPDDVIAFGDMPNDLPMMRFAGHAVAVGNAHVDVRSAADEVTTSNDEGGVASVLERVFGAAQPASEPSRAGSGSGSG